MDAFAIRILRNVPPALHISKERLKGNSVVQSIQYTFTVLYCQTTLFSNLFKSLTLYCILLMMVIT